MQKVIVGEPFTFKLGGEELAKVLLYYGYIPDTSSIEYKIVCPFHNDLNPSMIVNLEDGSYFCFGCGASGNAYNFVRTMHQELSDLQCVFKLFEILKSDKVCKIDFSKRRKKKKPQKELYDIAWDYYYGLSNVDWKNSQDEEVIKCRDYMLQRGFSVETLIACKAKITYNNPYPIIFPMLDNKTFKGWVCRTTTKEIEAKRKYLYNTGFSRATTLVGSYENVETVFIVEGYMDRLKFIQYGVTNVVAILGWKMSKEQEDELKAQGITHVISALDNDTCGEKGTKYLKTIFDKVTRFTYLKGLKDPGDISSQQMFDKMYQKTMKVYQQNNIRKGENKNGFIRQN